MGGFPVVFIGYELANNALEAYQSQNNPRGAIKALLREVESETHSPASIVRYDDDTGCTHTVVCCFADLRKHAYSSKELDAIPIPAEFSRVPERVKTSSDLRRVFAPEAMVYSYDSNGKTRINADVVIGVPSSTRSEIVASADLGAA